MKHDFALDSRGKIDEFRLDAGYHNGPQCLRCDQRFCHHCNENIYNEECPSSQMELFTTNEIISGGK